MEKKTIFSSSTEALFKSRSVTARPLVWAVLKNEQWLGGGTQAYGYAARHSPLKWAGRLAI